MQRKMSEKLVVVLPGLLLAMGLAYAVSQLGDQGNDEFPIFSQSVWAEVSASGVQDSPRRIPINVTPHAILSQTSENIGEQVPHDLALASDFHDSAYNITVVDEEGLPVPNARLELIERSSLNVNARKSEALLNELSRTEQKTDKNGDFAFTDSRHSRFEIQVHVPGYASKRYRLHHPGSRLIKLTRKSSIVGTVFDSEGVALPGIDVRLRHDAMDEKVVKTDINGFYRFSDVTPTSATLRINDSQYRRQVEHRIQMAGRIAYQQNFYLEAGDRLEVSVLSSNGSPAQGAVVSLIELDTALRCGTLITTATGTADFRCLTPDASYMVIVRHGSSTGRTRVQKRAKGNAEKTTVQLHESRIFRGRVRARNGDDLFLAGVQVTFESELESTSADMEQITAITDENGEFEISGLDPMLNYTAFLYHQAYAFGVEENVVRAETTSESGGLVPASENSGELALVEFQLEAPTRFEGQVIGKNGMPIAKGYVTLDKEGLDPSITGSQLSVRPDPQGRFSFTNLASGIYFLNIRDLKTGDLSDQIRIDVGNGAIYWSHPNATAGPTLISTSKN